MSKSAQVDQHLFIVEVVLNPYLLQLLARDWDISFILAISSDETELWEASLWSTSISSSEEEALMSKSSSSDNGGGGAPGGSPDAGDGIPSLRLMCHGPT